EIRLETSSVSRKHLRLRCQGSEIELEDLGSSNGTSLGGVRVASRSRAPWRAGQTLEVGNAVLTLVAGSLAPEAPGADGVDASKGEVGLPEDVVVDSRVMRDLYATLARVARTRVNVLLLGETGTGKDVAARSLHALSPRASGPLVSVNCASLSESML